jgi:hypothetical protein
MESACFSSIYDMKTEFKLDASGARGAALRNSSRNTLSRPGMIESARRTLPQEIALDQRPHDESPSGVFVMGALC